MSDASVQAIPIHLRPDELRSFFKGELVVEPRLNWRESLVRGPIAALTAPTFLYNVIAICWAFFIVCKLMAGGSASTGEGLVFILGAERLILLCVFIGSYEYAWNDLDFARPRSVPHGSYVFLPRLAAFGACLLWLWSPQGKGNGRAIFTGLAAWLALAIGITGLGNGWRRPVEEYFASAGSPFGLGLAAFGLLVWWTLSPRREKQPWAHGAGIFLAMLPCIWFAVWWWLGAVEPRWWYAELSGTR